MKLNRPLQKAVGILSLAFNTVVFQGQVDGPHKSDFEFAVVRLRCNTSIYDKTSVGITSTLALNLDLLAGKPTDSMYRYSHVSVAMKIGPVRMRPRYQITCQGDVQVLTQPNPCVNCVSPQQLWISLLS